MSASKHSNTAAIERELAELGEAPASAEELAMFDTLEQDPEVASVARLAELAEPCAFDDLSELELHRAWRSVERRGAKAPAEAAPHPSGGGPRRWLFAAIGLAAAAAILLIVTRPTDDEQLAQTQADAEAVAELGEQARASLKLLDDGASDTQRAEQLAAEYQARLEEQDG